jgi:hypothetical protein
MIHILAGGGDTHPTYWPCREYSSHTLSTEIKMSGRTFRETVITPKSVLLH